MRQDTQLNNLLAVPEGRYNLHFVFVEDFADQTRRCTNGDNKPR
jgi:hypothetical protein